MDVYNYNNPLKYSISSYDLFPPYIKNRKYINNGKEIIDEKHKEFENSRIIFENEILKNMKMVSYISNRQKEKHL